MKLPGRMHLAGQRELVAAHPDRDVVLGDDAVVVAVAVDAGAEITAAPNQRCAERTTVRAAGRVDDARAAFGAAVVQRPVEGRHAQVGRLAGEGIGMQRETAAAGLDQRRRWRARRRHRRRGSPARRTRLSMRAFGMRLSIALTTPPTALPPYSSAAGPRSTSMRSTDQRVDRHGVVEAQAGRIERRTGIARARGCGRRPGRGSPAGWRWGRSSWTTRRAGRPASRRACRCGAAPARRRTARTTGVGHVAAAQRVAGDDDGIEFCCAQAGAAAASRAAQREVFMAKSSPASAGRHANKGRPTHAACRLDGSLRTQDRRRAACVVGP